MNSPPDYAVIKQDYDQTSQAPGTPGQEPSLATMPQIKEAPNSPSKLNVCEITPLFFWA